MRLPRRALFALMLSVVLLGSFLAPASAKPVRDYPPSYRIVAWAERYVGHARYVSGGASPRTGFDCSGYTAWVYRHARIASLPHSAQAQRFTRHMHRIRRRAARPGDLVFYLSGRDAYHVAIYAGHGMQFAAATPRDGVRYQHIWSRDVIFGTDWH